MGSSLALEKGNASLVVDTHGQSPWHFFKTQALLDALRASSHSPTGKARGTLPFGLLEELPKEERRLVEGYSKGLYADFMMREEMQRIRSEHVIAEERYQELRRQLAHLDKALSYQGQIEELAQRLSAGIEVMSFNERRELLRLLVDEIVYDDGHVTIKTIIPLGNGQLYPVSQGTGRA